MKSIRKLFIVASVLLIAGCSAYQLPSLTASHPANPKAIAAPENPLPKTLAYTRADLPSSRPMMGMVAQQGGREGQEAQSNRQTAVGEGKIVTTIPSAGQIVVEHGEIRGFMDAMTMGYRVEPPSLLEGLKAGDRVQFTIDIPRKAIVRIKKGAGLAAATSSQEDEGSRSLESSPRSTVVGEGKVVATVPNAGQIVVDHQEIKGFMEAMTMGYRIDPPSLLEGLKFGDRIRFTIDVQKKAIIKIEKMP